jgi:hypothetical protein
MPGLKKNGPTYFQRYSLFLLSRSTDMKIENARASASNTTEAEIKRNERKVALATLKKLLQFVAPEVGTNQTTQLEDML